MLVTAVHTVMVQTTDMERSVAFYRDVLGLTPGYTSPYWSDFAVGGTRLGIHPILREGGKIEPFSNAIICLESNDLAGVRAAILNSNGQVAGEFHQTPGGVIFDVLDPDGNNLQFIQPNSKLSDFSSK
ncbi:VOC family protein [Kamptonema cortianum]|nr:VOC family protein [Geitlerinema splendidum]MDK3162444.1 VOC family protein [Kamptonema cortianum]